MEGLFMKVETVETVDFKNFFFQPFLFLNSDSGIKLFNNNTNNANN